MNRRISLILLVLLCLTPVSVRYWIQQVYGAECGVACKATTWSIEESFTSFEPAQAGCSEYSYTCSDDTVGQLARANLAVLGASSGAGASGCVEGSNEIGNRSTATNTGISKDEICCNIHTADCSGKTKTAYMYSSADSGYTGTVCIYDCPGGDTCDGSAAPTANAAKRSCSGLLNDAADWVSSAMDTAYSVTSTSAYWICFSSDGVNAWNGNYTTGAGRFTAACSNCGANAASMPANLAATWTGPTANRNIAMYVTIGD